MKTDDPMHYARIPLRIAYCRDTDTLEIRNGEEVISSYGVAKGLIAHLDSDGETAGFTLEKAQALLLPQLSEYDDTSTKTPLVAAAGYGFALRDFFESSRRNARQEPSKYPQYRVLP